jgi:hypothetical protein
MLDADGDGSLDLYFPQPTWLPGCDKPEKLQARLFLNDGHGQFREVPGAGGAVCHDYGIGAAVADYDNDGKPDLFVSCFGRSHLFHNEGGGRFRDVSERAHLNCPRYPSSAAWLDFDGDGSLDLFVCGYVEFDPSMTTHCPTGDGREDYCTPEAFSPAKNALFRNNRDGTFTNVTQAAGLASTSARALGALAVDFDDDHKIDLFVANDTSPNMLFRNLGGRFEDVAMREGVAYGSNAKAQSNMGIACGDYNRDGRPDVLVTTFANEPDTLYRNEGDFFTDVTAESRLSQATLIPLGFGAAFVDADQDGWPDLFIANGHVEQYIATHSATQKFAQPNQLFRNNGRGGFEEISRSLPPDDVKVHRGVAVGDIDGDGDQDLVVTALNDQPVILRNDTRGGHWLTVELRNRFNSASVIGAKVRVTAGGGTQTSWVFGGGSYISQSDYARHFGLGTATRADSVEITWPDGEKQTLTGVSADQRLVIRRGASPSRHESS